VPHFQADTPSCRAAPPGALADGDRNMIGFHKVDVDERPGREGQSRTDPLMGAI